MKVRLISLILAFLLLTGCSPQSSEHTVSLDGLSITLPVSFSPETTENTDQAFMYRRDQQYITGFKESKQELSEYFQQLSLDGYVEKFTQYNLPETTAEQTEGLWKVVYTSTVEDTEYTFICVFYETEEHFWRVQACCPTEHFAENRQNLWKYIASAD